MLQNETVTGGGRPPEETCEYCGGSYSLKVMKTCAYYVGVSCDSCGSPWSRETGYFAHEEEAVAAKDRIKRADLSDIRAYL